MLCTSLHAWHHQKSHLAPIILCSQAMSHEFLYTFACKTNYPAPPSGLKATSAMCRASRSAISPCLQTWKPGNRRPGCCRIREFRDSLVEYCAGPRCNAFHRGIGDSLNRKLAVQGHVAMLRCGHTPWAFKWPMGRYCKSLKQEASGTSASCRAV